MAFVLNVIKWLLAVDSTYYVLSGIYYYVVEPHQCSKTMWFANTPSKHETLIQCWLTVCDTGPASNQRLVFAGLCSIARWSCNAYCWRRVQADTDPMSVKCWASDADQYPFSAQPVFIQRSARRRWVKCISQALGQRLVWAASARTIETAGPLCVQRGRHNY